MDSHVCKAALALLLIGAYAVSSVVAQIKVQATGTIQQYPSSDVSFDYFLAPKLVSGDSTPITDATLWWLMFQTPSSADQLIAGQTVKVTGFLMGTRLWVVAISVQTNAPPQDFFYGAPSVTLSSITLVVSMCNKKAVDSIPALRGKWTIAGAIAAKTDTSNTLEALYRDCSWGKVQFPDSDNIIVDLTNQTPPANVSSVISCTGSTMECSGVTSNLQSGPCATVRQAWMNWALERATQVYGINTTRYMRRVLLIPGLDVFGVSGMAQIGYGVDVPTNAFIRGEYAMYSLRSPFHELGHNYGLQHSWSNETGSLNDYGDLSCAMGSVTDGGPAPRCFNAPQTWYAGWSEPLADLNATTLVGGTWYVYYLPTYLSKNTNLIRVVPTWMPKTNPDGSVVVPIQPATSPTYFFSYRQALKQDALLDPEYLGTVSVHIYDGTREGSSRAFPVMVGQIQKGTTFNIRSLGYKIQLISTSSTNCRVHMCRYTQTTETDCTNGLDDDCNGLTDAKDPACNLG